MKVKKQIYVIVVIALSMAIIYSVIYSFINHGQDTFWSINVFQSITLGIAIFIAYGATQFRNDERKLKEQTEKMLNKIQSIVYDKNFYTIKIIHEEEDDAECSKNIMMTIRKMRNNISILEQYCIQQNFQEDINYIKNTFKSYDEIVSEHINDLNYLAKSESLLRKYAENIGDKCDFIILQLYT